MTARNTYATLAEYKSFVVSRGQTASTDTNDDAVIDTLLEQASRYLDAKTGRWFFPRIETRYYSIPDYPAINREVDFNADLLEVITFLNGDGSSIAASEYHLWPRNEYPKFGLKIKESSNFQWLTDDSEFEYVLPMTAYFGYHPNYLQDAWKSVGTLGSAITDTTTLAFTMTAGHTLAVGNIAKIDNELNIIGTVATNTITPLKRGDNGSTAATHLNGATVYIWQPMNDCKSAVLEIAMQAYKRRFGQSLSNTETTTGAGVILTPKDIPTMAGEFIQTYRRRV